MKKGGAAFPDLQVTVRLQKKTFLKAVVLRALKGGSTISDADSKKIKKILPKLFVPGESGKNISDADLKKLMKPTNFKDGGEVRGMGRAYMGASRKAKIR